jgi:hypothetical protein
MRPGLAGATSRRVLKRMVSSNISIGALHYY